MRKSFWLIALLFSSPALTASATCVNISGSYRIPADERGESLAVRFQQTGCASLQMRYGRIDENGKAQWFRSVIQVSFDGIPSCQTGTCWTAAASNETISLRRDTSGPTYDPRHGACQFHEENYAPLASGEVSRIQMVHDCDDGFAGASEALLTPLRWLPPATP